MPDRPICESKLEYQELMAGRSPHKGEIFSAINTPLEAKVDPYQEANFNQPPPVAEVPASKAEVIPPRARMAQVRGHISHWIKKWLK